MPRLRLLPILLFGLLGLDVSAAWAAKVSVNPVRLHLSAKQRSEVIEIRNSGVETSRFQAKAHAWHESADGQMTLVPTRDLLFFPSLLEVPPGETRRIRVASTARPGPAERSYRLVIDEFPRAPTPGAVQVLTRLSLPVFVQPAAPKPVPSIAAHLESGQLVIVVANRGNAYFKAESLRVVGRSASGEVVFEHTQPGWYVLAAGQRRYTVALAEGACREIEVLSTTLRTDKGDASATSSAQPDSACGE